MRKLDHCNFNEAKLVTKGNEHYLPLICQDRSENEVSFLERLNIEAQRTVLAYNLSR
jgi:hypothetical protein